MTSYTWKAFPPPTPLPLSPRPSRHFRDEKECMHAIVMAIIAKRKANPSIYEKIEGSHFLQDHIYQEYSHQVEIKF